MSFHVDGCCDYTFFVSCLSVVKLSDQMANKEASPAIQYHIHSTQNLTVAEEITVVESAEIDGAESDADDGKRNN